MEQRVSPIARRSLASLLVLVVVGLAGAESALACSCLPPDHSRFRGADAAFVGRLIAVRPIDVGGELISSADPADYVYRIRRVLKPGRGLRAGRRVVVRSARQDASCGLSHRRGVLTGLLLYREGGRWSSGSCGQMTPRRLRRIRAGSGPSAAGSAGSSAAGGSAATSCS